MDFFTNLLADKKSGDASAAPVAAVASSPEPHHPTDLSEVSTKDLLRLTQKLQKTAKKWESRANGAKLCSVFHDFPRVPFHSVRVRLRTNTFADLFAENQAAASRIAQLESLSDPAATTRYRLYFMRIVGTMFAFESPQEFYLTHAFSLQA